MVEEIGSEYWISSLPLKTYEGVVPQWLEKWPNLVLTSSGRGAIDLMIHSVIDKIKQKKALLPAYCCHTMIDPFIRNGFEVYFYDINYDDLSPDISQIEKYLNLNIGVFLHMGYFGFNTNNNLKDILIKFKNNGTYIIEDVTHTMFSNITKDENNDFFVSSIRKWIGVPSGGFLSSKAKLNSYKLQRDIEFSSLRLEALRIKSDYIKTSDNSLKPVFLNLFHIAEEALNRKSEPYSIDCVSNSILNEFDPDVLIQKRIENYIYLDKKLKSNRIVRTLFKNISPGTCPMFLTLYIKDKRDEVRCNLIKNKIYAPVHWPKPSEINGLINPGFETILNEIVSIPIDQRYGIADMDKIAYIINDY